MNRRSRLLVLAATASLALAAAGAASAHAVISPPVALDKTLQVFTLSVPTEKEGATTTTVELTVPKGFSIDSFAPPPAGWTMKTRDDGATWSGGHVPTGQDAVFQFNASTSGAKTYTFQVRQTYSDGAVVDWTGPESSDTPAPRVEAVSSLGGGGNSTLDIIALALGGGALLLALAALLTRGERTLT